MANRRILLGLAMLAVLATLQVWQLRRLRELKREIFAQVECACELGYR